jgi:hypothetical protein
MPLSSTSPRDRDDHRAKLWTATILAAGLVTTGAVVAGVARGHHEARRTADVRQVASSSERVRHAGGGPAVPRLGSAFTCPTGATPSVVIDDVRVHPALDHGIWFHPGHYRIAVRGHVVNGTNAAVEVKGVHWTVGGSPWGARTRVPGALRSESMEDVVASGRVLSTTRERMTLAGRLFWSWQSPRARSCNRSRLIDDD